MNIFQHFFKYFKCSLTYLDSPWNVLTEYGINKPRIDPVDLDIGLHLCILMVKIISSGVHSSPA